MPYTFVHPAYVLPFRRWWPKVFDFSALVMGSFAPDLDIIYRFSETRHHIFTYSASNILFMILPIAVILSIYMRLVMLPIFTTGLPAFNRQAILETLKKLPVIIFSALAAILLHVFIDDITHIHDTQSKSIAIGAELGKDPDQVGLINLALIYGPQLLGSFIALVILSYQIILYRSFLWKYTAHLRSKPGLWIQSFTLITIVFTLMKHIKAGVETEMSIDSYIISITCGLMSAFLLSPVYFRILEKIKHMRIFHLPFNKIFSVLLPVIISFYLLGLPTKEYLSIFILKGLFLLTISALGISIHYRIISAQQYNFLTWFFLGLFFLLCIMNPFTGGIKILLGIQGVILTLLLLTSILKTPAPLGAYVRYFGYISLYLATAYYCSGKGLGPGIAVLIFLGMLISYRSALQAILAQTDPSASYTERSVQRLLTITTLIEMALILLVLLSREASASVLIFVAACFVTLILRWIFSFSNWLNTVQILYRLWLPLCGVVFIGSAYSHAYALLSLAALQIFFPDTLSDSLKSYFPGRKKDAIVEYAGN